MPRSRIGLITGPNAAHVRDGGRSVSLREKALHRPYLPAGTPIVSTKAFRVTGGRVRSALAGLLSADCLPQGTAPQRHEGRCGRRFRLETVREALAAVSEVALVNDNVMASMRMAVSVAKLWVVSVWLASPRPMEQLKETVVGAACCTTSLG